MMTAAITSRGEAGAAGLERRRWLLCALAVLLSAGPQLALAQNAPAGGGSGGDADVRRMIESLRGAPTGAQAGAPTGAPTGGGRTRNLVVVPNAEREPAAAPAAPAAPSPPAAAPAFGAPPQLLSPGDVANLLGVSEGDVLATLEKGELKGKRIGSTWRVTKTALDEFLKS